MGLGLIPTAAFIVVPLAAAFLSLGEASFLSSKKRPVILFENPEMLLENFSVNLLPSFLYVDGFDDDDDTALVEGVALDVVVEVVEDTGVVFFCLGADKRKFPIIL